MPDQQVTSLQYLSAPDVARRMRVDLHKVHRWIKSGRLLARNINEPGQRPCWRIHPADLERFFESLPAGKPAPRAPARPATPRFFK